MKLIFLCLKHWVGLNACERFSLLGGIHLLPVCMGVSSQEANEIKKKFFFWKQSICIFYGNHFASHCFHFFFISVFDAKICTLHLRKSINTISCADDNWLCLLDYTRWGTVWMGMQSGLSNLKLLWYLGWCSGDWVAVMDLKFRSCAVNSRVDCQLRRLLTWF